ncbi:MAG: DUF3604 domain-containing protein [Woeseiaceae bacterium]
MTIRRLGATTGLLLILGISACGDNSAVDQPAASMHETSAAPAVANQANGGSGNPSQVFFGETHLHTALSMDAGMTGTTLMPADGYRFAKGEEVISNTGQAVKLSKPLDFVVVADHSDNLGFATDFYAGAEQIVSDEKGKRWYDMAQAGQKMEAFNEYLIDFANGQIPEALNYVPGNPAFATAWETIIQAAEEANEPGKFTAFIGYEWTSMPNGNNLHRNVIYRNDGDYARQMLPYTTAPPLGSPDPRDLWEWMSQYEKETGGQLLAIAHNGNWSNGWMFPSIEPDTGEAIDSTYAELRSKWEPLYEVTQTKGDGEAHPMLSPNDEFADYATWDASNAGPTAAKTDDMLEFEYARSAYKNGLEFEQTLGANPYNFGLVGSTDSHVGITAVEEDNFFGKVANVEPSAERWEHVFLNNAELGITIMNWETTSAGYAAVWAQENTRESLFDAMARKETYATTGTRPVVRFFGGYGYAADDLARDDLVDHAYANGVPMGGELQRSATAPSFIVLVQKDPEGANLDRAQVVKGWLDVNGEAQEEVYDVAWGDADTRQADANGKVADVGNTVDVSNATWENSIGDPELQVVWTDPDFDTERSAFYYLRVIEIPTPRWTAYDAKKFGIEMDPEIPMVHTERAYTSPIWYKP